MKLFFNFFESASNKLGIITTISLTLLFLTMIVLGIHTIVGGNPKIFLIGVPIIFSLLIVAKISEKKLPEAAKKKFW